MTLIKFISVNGDVREVNADSGSNLMQVALDNGIDEILGECGGSCSCATCHCYIAEDWLDKSGKPDEIEQEMLECTLDPAKNSRLACQVNISNELDGMVVHLPEAQY